LRIQRRRSADAFHGPKGAAIGFAFLALPNRHNLVNVCCIFINPVLYTSANVRSKILFYVYLLRLPFGASYLSEEDLPQHPQELRQNNQEHRPTGSRDPSSPTHALSTAIATTTTTVDMASAINKHARPISQQRRTTAVSGFSYAYIP
jgi:hypothetical protein